MEAVSKHALLRPAESLYKCVCLVHEKEPVKKKATETQVILATFFKLLKNTNKLLLQNFIHVNVNFSTRQLYMLQ